MKTEFTLLKKIKEARLLLISILLLLASFLISKNAKAQWEETPYLRIGAVQNSWYTYPGSIDTVVFEIKPMGLYTEIGMIFDFSSRGTSFSQYDSLEVQMLFDLPFDAEITDMWLWIADSIVHAGMYDRWTASQIYEEIVARRTDPAILYRYAYNSWSTNDVTYSDKYMFRIFPMLTTLPRKSKITFMVPTADLYKSSSSVSLPINILKLSHLPILSTKIKYYPAFGSQNPVLLENTATPFTYHAGNPGEEYYEATIPESSSFNSLTISTSTPQPENIFAGIFEDNSDNSKYYELQIIPNQLFGISKSKKALFLLDFVDANCNGYTSEQMLQELKLKIRNYLQPTDSFNILISGMITQFVSNEWVSCDSANIEDVFASFSASSLNNYSSLPTLLMDGINYIKERNNEGAIILVASSNSNGAYEQANDLINDYLALMDSVEIPIHIVDLDDFDNSNESQYIGNQYYYGNEYLYTNLSMQTVGEYMSLKEYSFSNMLINVFNKISGYFTSFDMYVTLESGYTFSNYNFQSGSAMLYYDQPFQRVGKFTGSGRFHVFASAQLPSGEFYYADFFIENNNVNLLTGATRAGWAAHLIDELFAMNQNNSVISQIINTSIQKRVLSNYTAFLALEPGVGNLNGDGDPYVTSATEQFSTEITASIFPNPVTDVLKISINLPEAADVLIELYDLLGKRIAVVFKGKKERDTQEISFNLQNVPAGTYFCKIIAGQKTISTEKIIVIK